MDRINRFILRPIIKFISCIFWLTAGFIFFLAILSFIAPIGLLGYASYFEYTQVKEEFKQSHMQNTMTLSSIFGDNISPLLNYRFKTPYGDEIFFHCYADFFAVPFNPPMEKLLEQYQERLTVSQIEEKYPHWPEMKKCIGNAIDYPENEIQQRWYLPSFTYIKIKNAWYPYSDLLVNGNTENIKLSLLHADDLDVYVSQYGRDIYSSQYDKNTYRALIVYPNRNIVKMVTAGKDINFPDQKTKKTQ